MPTSKDTRVRVDDFEKIIAHVWPASGLACWPRFALNSRASANSAGNSDAVKSVSLRKCFMETVRYEPRQPCPRVKNCVLDRAPLRTEGDYSSGAFSRGNQ